jgi:hypothetical protein
MLGSVGVAIAEIAQNLSLLVPSSWSWLELRGNRLQL